MHRLETFQAPLAPSLRAFKDCLITGGKDILANGIDVYVPNPISYSCFKDHLHELIHGDRVIFQQPYRFSENGFLMSALLETAIVDNDSTIIEAVIEAFDQNVLNEDYLNEQGTDWCIEGKVAIQLYDITHDEKYKTFADAEYHWLKERETNDGILYIGDRTCNFVDGLGIFNPFLVSYAQYFNVPEAYELAVRQIDLWCIHGVDRETGVPCMEYSLLLPYEKHRSANWGRGCAWYALGLLSIDKKDLKEETQALVDSFDNALKTLWERNHEFTQFLGIYGDQHGGHQMTIDLSATLPLLYYLQKEGLVTKVTTDELLKYSQCMDNNIMKYSSGGAFYPGDKTVDFGSSQRLSQAFMLKLLNEINETEAQ